MNQALNYNQVTSIPRKCIVKSRSECDTSIDFCGHRFQANFLPANMASVVNEDICKWLAFNNYFYIYHRFGDTRKFIQRARAEAWPLVSISVGAQESDKELIKDIAESKCRVHFATIDIAHSYAYSTVEMIKFLKKYLPNTKVIAGNIWGDKDSVEFLQDAGADCLKIGLSCGAGCCTFNQTSFGSPMFSAALEAGKWAKVPVILDGGIREAGDIARAMIGFTTTQKTRDAGNGYVYFEPRFVNPINIPMVMIGSLFAACIDAPGENIYSTEIMEAFKSGYTFKDLESFARNGHNTEVKFKKYYGSASAESKKKTGQEVKHIEGKSIEIPCNGMTYAEYYDSLKQSIQSQISYGGGKDLSCFKDVQWRVIS